MRGVLCVVWWLAREVWAVTCSAVQCNPVQLVLLFAIVFHRRQVPLPTRSFIVFPFFQTWFPLQPGNWSQNSPISRLDRISSRAITSDRLL